MYIRKVSKTILWFGQEMSKFKLGVFKLYICDCTREKGTELVAYIST